MGKRGGGVKTDDTSLTIPFIKEIDYG